MKHYGFLLAALLYLSGVSAQEHSNQQPLHEEIPNDPHILVDKTSMQRSPAYNNDSNGIMTRQVNVDNSGANIVGDAANEPSIAVDPTNPNRIVIGWRQFDTVASDFRQAGYGYSLDGGETWTFPGVLDPGVFRSDPVMDFDANGNFYYNSLTADPTLTIFACDVFKIDDGGVNWNAPVPARGGDKGWMRVDRSNGIGAGNIYSQWSFFAGECDPLNFTRSTDGAQSFENCSEIPNFPRFGTIAVNADGDVYQSGFDTPGILVQKSVTAKDPDQDVTWEPLAIVPLGGSLTGGGPNAGGILGHIWVDVDVSTGSGAGNVYVLASVKKDSSGDPADVMFSKSIDGGQTFSLGQQINTDPGDSAHQWFGTLSVAPNGRIDVIWLDTRDATLGTFDSVLYYSFSEDEGESWSPNTPISESFNPRIGWPGGNEKLGDYVDMVSDNNYAHLAWANTFTGGQDVYYTRITPELTLQITDNNISNLDFIVSPNPINETTTVSFRLEDAEVVLLEVIDIHGRNIDTLLDGTVSGDQSVLWDGGKLSSGIYFVRLKTTREYLVTKIVIE